MPFLHHHRLLPILLPTRAADLTFVGVSLKGKICDTWYTEGPQAVQPTNLYYAMKQRRLGGSAMAPGLLRRAKRME